MYLLLACAFRSCVSQVPLLPEKTPARSTLQTVVVRQDFFFFVSVYLTFHFPPFSCRRLTATDWPRLYRGTVVNSITAPASVFICNIDIKW